MILKWIKVVVEERNNKVLGFFKSEGANNPNFEGLDENNPTFGNEEGLHADKFFGFEVHLGRVVDIFLLLDCIANLGYYIGDTFLNPLLLAYVVTLAYLL